MLAAEPRQVCYSRECALPCAVNDVFFWNNHLAFFVGDQGFLCRFGLTPDPTSGPGFNIAKQLAGDKGKP